MILPAAFALTLLRVYLIEGIATIFFAGVVFVYLPDYPKSPRSSRWLTVREQEFIEVRLPENAPKTEDPDFSMKEVIASLKSPLIWSFMLSQMLVNFGNYALTWYLPTIVTNLGKLSPRCHLEPPGLE